MSGMVIPLLLVSYYSREHSAMAAQLTVRQVLAIFKEGNLPHETYNAVARRHLVSARTVGMICRGETWRWLTMPGDEMERQRARLALGQEAPEVLVQMDAKEQAVQKGADESFKLLYETLKQQGGDPEQLEVMRKIIAGEE
jgi:hypothetical protein